MVKIALIPGDGIGCEVVAQASRVLESLGGVGDHRARTLKRGRGDGDGNTRHRKILLVSHAATYRARLNALRRTEACVYEQHCHERPQCASQFRHAVLSRC